MEEIDNFVYTDINNTDLRMREFKDSQPKIITESTYTTDTTDTTENTVNEIKKSYMHSNVYIPLKDLINPENTKELSLYQAYLQVAYNQSLLLTKQESKVNENFKLSKYYENIEHIIFPFFFFGPVFTYKSLRKRSISKNKSILFGLSFCLLNSILIYKLESIRVTYLFKFFEEEIFKQEGNSFTFDEYLGFIKQKKLSMV